METIPQKYCSGCKQSKPLIDFAKNSAMRDGLQNWCRQCLAQHRAKLQADPEYAEEKRARERDYYRNNDEARLRHREAGRAREKERWRNDPAVRQRKNLQKQQSVDKLKQDPQWYAKHLAWGRKARNHRRAKIDGNGGSFTKTEWDDLCAKYDYRCLACGEKKPLTVDHVIPISKGGLNSIDNIQPLCGSCNRRKHTKVIDYR